MLRGKILTVTLNAALDRVVAVDGGILAPNAIHSARILSSLAGGKGIAVSRALNALGIPNCAMLLAGGVTGRIICEGLDVEGIEYEMTPVEHESRLRFTMATAGASATEINEEGPSLAPRDEQAFMADFREKLPEAAAVAICGTLPQGMTRRFYENLIREAKQAGKISVLDTSGAPLVAGVGAKPWAVTPNLDEAEFLVGFKIHKIEDAIKAVRNIMQRIEGIAFVTAADSGAFFGIGDSVYHVSAPEVELVSRVGAGDAFLAGYLAGWYRGLDPLDAARLAAGAAASSVRRWGAGVIDKAEAEALAEKVEVKCVYQGDMT